MSEAFIGEIRMFAGDFAPRSWAFCDGQLLAVSQNDALFALLGTIYGGDGRTTFGLPDMRGRVPMHYGNGPGLSNRPLGIKAGAENVTVTEATMPTHSHQPTGKADANVGADPSGNVTGQATKNIYRSPPDNNLNMASEAITSVGGNQQHNNMAPFLCINFIIALFGVFPSRN